jgi:hypothetical protein
VLEDTKDTAITKPKQQTINTADVIATNLPRNPILRANVSFISRISSMKLFDLLVRPVAQPVGALPGWVGASNFVPPTARGLIRQLSFLLKMDRILPHPR